MKASIILTVLLMISGNLVFSQRVLNYSGHTVLFDEYNGKENFTYYVIDSNEVRHGRYLFNSELVTLLDQELIKNLSIAGTYKNGLKEDVWTYTEGNYSFRFNSINKWKLSTTLDGFETKYMFRYKLGLPNGEWKITKNIVADNYIRNIESEGSVNFKDGLAVGKLNYKGKVNGNFFKIEGQLDDKGFLNGVVQMEYSIDSIYFYETRRYNSGLLMSLKITEKNTGVIIQDIFYDDVQLKLEILETNADTLNFTISNRGFGIEFNNGYRPDEAKLYAQFKANTYLKHVFSLFEKYEIENSVYLDKSKPIYSLTKRFKFLYPTSDDSMINILNPKVENLSKEIIEYINNPKHVLNSQKSDSLAYSYAFILKSIEKLDIIKNTLRRIDSGDFDFQYRPNYYKNGIEGLDKVDAFKYSFENKEKVAVFDIGKKITNHQDLLFQINEYLNLLNDKVHSILQYSRKEIRYLKEGSKIDSLDILIVELKNKLDQIYLLSLPANFEPKLGSKKVRGTVTEVLYIRFRLEKIEMLSSNYVREADFEKKIAISSELIATLQTLISNHNKIIQIERMPKSLDSAFTRYIENPFMDRMAESRIKQNIYNRGAVRLLDYKIDLLKNAATYEEINFRVEEIFKLRDRLIELANSDDPEVERLNKRLRRETVPERIKRLLGL
jgi:hypothetical protein